MKGSKSGIDITLSQKLMLPVTKKAMKLNDKSSFLRREASTFKIRS